jgi:hypothetical protein
MYLPGDVLFPQFLVMSLFLKRAPAADPGGPGSPGGQPSVEARASGYDRVGVAQDGGETRWLSRGEFQALPLTERVRILAGGGARFYRGSLEVSPMEAMRGMP